MGGRGLAGELRRDGLIGELLAGGVIERAGPGGGHGHRLDRALTAAMTMLCVVTGALFPGQGYDMILAKAFAMPGTRVRPGTPVADRPRASRWPAPGWARRPCARAYELDAARDDVPLGAGGTAFGLELVIFDGTTLDLFACPELAAEFGVPEGGAHPKLRSSRCCRRDAAVEGRRRRRLPRGGERPGRPAGGRARPGQLSLADRGFFSMDRWLRFSATGAHLLWRVKNSARSVPFRQLRTLKDGSELVLLRRAGTCSAGAAASRRPSLPRLPDTVARLAASPS